MKLHTTPRRLALVTITLSAMGALPALGQTINEDFKLLAKDGARIDRFGNSVSISGTTAVIGAFFDDDNGDDSGSAYLFDTTTGQQLFKLLPNDGAGEDLFGYSVAICGTTVVVGAHEHNGTGKAFLFDTATGRQMSILQRIDIGPADEFGYSVAISGTTAVVGAWLDDDNGSSSGSAYLFDTTNGQQLFKLLPSDGAQEDYFGHSVAISGTTAVVGAWLDDDNGSSSGSAYLFDTTNGQQIAKLLPNDGAQGDYFGHSVAISGTTAVVGAHRNDDNGTDSGSAYLFDTTTGEQVAKLLPNDAAAGDWFGRSVAISGNTAIVGTRAESAYLFDTTTGKQIGKLVPKYGEYDDDFGYSVAISGATAVVGAWLDDDNVNGNDSGSAYVFPTSPTPCPADLTGDGELNFFDVSVFLTYFQLSDPIADFTGDGSFNFFDVSAFLSAFNAGCP